MSALTDMLDQLIGLDARAKAAESLAKPIRQKATAMVRERFEEEGTDRFVRDGATISLVKPTPYAEVTQPETLCDFLAGDLDRGDLVTEQVAVIDQQALASLIGEADGVIGETSPDVEKAVSALVALLMCTDVRRKPVSDWADHVQHEVAADGTMVTPDGVVIPGARWITPEPRSITVRLDAETKAAAELLLVTELGGAG